jgi:serine/threonine-protein kinase
VSGSAYARLEALFHAALEQPQAQRERFVDDACCDDAGLRRRLRAMLAHDARDEDPLAAAVRDGQREVRRQAETMPERFGPFRLLRRLGQGGMGTVYLGEREGSDFEQRVAIKLLRDLDDSQVTSARLRRERQLLARLEHPHIARLIDGGECDDGTPFVAMEYVEGLGLTRHAAGLNLGLEARLRLFLQLLDAIAYAHRHLIVHRDIKPDNVLVDADGNVKLLDFGIAKLLDAPGTIAAAATMTVAAAMTPCYASPEQLLGQPVSTQSDVYSLGVVLYELLTGSLPFPPDAQVSALQLQNRICTTQPVAPSQVGARVTPPRRLRGDLDNIVLKALRKEPLRRYASAEALADDLRRFLDGRPVSARPDTWRYRLGKFVARNRLGVGVSLALLATLLAFAVTSRWQATRYATERDRAEGEAAAATQVADYMIDLFRVPDPIETAKRDLSARDLLDKAAASLPTEMGKAPLLRARMMHVIGLSYANIGAYEPAVRMLKSALAIREAALGPDSFEVSDSLNRLGNVYRMYGQLGLAEQALGRALAIRERLSRGPDAELADAFNNVGLLQYELGHYRAALATLQRAIDMHRAVSGHDTESIAVALNNRALALHRLGRYAQAETEIRRAIEIKQASGLQDRSTLVNSQAILASLLFDEGRLDEAIALREQTLARRRALYPQGHPSLVAGLLNMGQLQLMRGNATDAGRLYDEALELARRVDSPSRLLTARALVMHGRMALATGNIADARTTFGQALAIRLAALAADSPDLAEVQYLAGLAALAGGDGDAAATLLTTAMHQRQAQLAPDHPRRRESRLALAALDAQRGRFAAARQAMQAVVDDAPPEHSLRSDLVTAWARRCLATTPVSPATAIDATSAGGHEQAARKLLSRYLRDGQRLLDTTARCPGIGWLAADDDTKAAAAGAN